MAATPRPLPTVLAELQEVRRHLLDAPPHHGAGVREALHARVRTLEREVAAAQQAAQDRDDTRRGRT